MFCNNGVQRAPRQTPRAMGQGWHSPKICGLWHFREGTEKLWAHLAQAHLGGYKGVWTEAYPGTYRKKATWR